MGSKREALVFGGATYDITSIVLQEPLPCDSNPSRIYGGCGGVGRNIAENMARMGMGVGMISAFGTDTFSQALLASCHCVNIDMSHSFIIEGAGACKYVSILDSRGELLIAAADLDLMESTPVCRIDGEKAYIEEFPLVFIDTNNTEEMLRHIADAANNRLFADTVSVKKAPRLRAILDRMDTIKLNRSELESLSGRPTASEKEIRLAADKLLTQGVKRVFVTMGMDGCCCCEGDSFAALQAFPAEVKNVTGAGDAFAAAIAYGSLRGYSNEEILLLGTAASHIALKSAYAVSKDLTEMHLLNLYSLLKQA